MTGRSPLRLRDRFVRQFVPTRTAMRLYRIAHALHLRGWIFSARFVSIWQRILTGVEIASEAEIGEGVVLRHGHGIVIGSGAVIGRRCVILQGVTVGVRHSEPDAFPTIGDDVTLYAGAKVLGGITIGDGAVIGANSVVLCDVPPGATAVGVPARILSRPAPGGSTGTPSSDPSDLSGA